MTSKSVMAEVKKHTKDQQELRVSEETVQALLMMAGASDIGIYFEIF